MTEIQYNTEKNCLCKISKGTSKSYLQFEFIEFDNELNHLNTTPNLEKEEKMIKAKLLRAEGKSNVAIAVELGVSEGTVRKWWKK
jgi:DNA-binding NarL/FixJ family response regulator